MKNNKWKIGSLLRYESDTEVDYGVIIAKEKNVADKDVWAVMWLDDTRSRESKNAMQHIKLIST